MGSLNWAAVLDVVQAITSIDNLDEFGPAVLEGVSRLVAFDHSSFNEVDPIGGRSSVVFHPSREPPEWERTAWNRWSHQNPMLMHMMRTGDGSTHRLSEYLTREELHRIELYVQLYGPLRTEFQMAFALPAPQPLVIGVALNRERHDFDSDEVTIAEALRPHVMQAYRRIQLIAEQRRAMTRIAGALAEEGRAFQILDDPVDGLPAVLLDRHFGPRQDNRLPVPVATWVEDERTASAHGPLGRLQQPLVSIRDNRRLVVRYVSASPGEPEMLSLDERIAEHDAQPLQRLGLSRRQAEVLWWLTKGASSATIAREMRVAVGTVKKHLDQVYRRLGVSSRAAAVAQAFDALTYYPSSLVGDGSPVTADHAAPV